MIEKFDTRLVALDFHRDIKRLTEDFVGRAWLFEEIDNWLHNTDQRFFILTGEPGSGKSAIAARLTQIRPDHIAAYHFCIASNIGTITPNTVLRSLAAQLGESLPGYSKALVNTIRPHQVSVNVRQEIGKVEVGAKVLGVVINHLTASSAEEELDILFRTPLTEVVPPKVPIIILIDSLDEAMTYHSQVGLLPLLAKTNDLPEWVRFVCTTRPEEAILSYFRQFELHTLATRSQMNLDDIEHYIDYRVDKDKMQTRLRATSIASENLTKQMADFADGNFLYVKILLDDIEAGRQLLEHLAALPRSLDDIYRGFLRRISDDDWDKKYQPILGKLTVAQEPITEKHLAQFTGMRQRQIRKSLAVVSQYLDVVEANDGSKTYRIFHQSLRDYLLDEERSGLFWCDSAEEHELLARYYLKTFQNGWRDCDLYGLRFLPIHLNAIYEYNSIHDLLLNFEWLAAKLQKTSLNELIADFNLVASDAHLQPIKTALLLSSHTLEQDKTQLAGQLLGHLINLKQDKVQSLLNQASTPRTGELFLRPLTHIFSPDRGRLVRTFAGCHDQEIFRTVVTLDGNHVISASQDGIVKVWEISTGQEILTLNSAQFIDTGFAQSYYLIMIIVSMDGQQLITVSHNNDWQRWDLTTGQRLSKQDSVIVGRPISEVSNFVDFPVSRVNRPTDPKRPDQPQQLLITPDGQRIVMVLDRMEDNPFLFDLSATLSSARLLSRGDKLEHITIDSHSSFSKPRLVLSPNGQYLSRPSPNGNGSEILVWDRTKSREQFNLSGHRARVNDLSMTPDSRYLISGSHDSTLKMWNLDTREATRTFYGHLKPVTAVTVTPDGTHAISVSIDGSLKVWDLQPTLAPDFVSDLPHHEGPICAVVATPDYKYVISGSVDQSIKVWYWPVHEATLRLRTTFEGHQRRVNGLAVSSDSQYLVSVSDERSIKVWDLITLTLSRTIVDQPLGVTAVPLYQHLTSGVATIPGSTQFVAEALEGGLKVGDCITGQVSQVLQGTYEWTQGIASTPDGQYVITAHFRENRLIVWHLPSGKSYRLYEDGQHLETYYDSPVMRTFFTKHFFGEDTERPYYSAIAVTSDGKYVIAGSTEGQITIWDLLTLEKQCSIQAHQDTVTALATIPNLPYVVSCSRDCNLSIWDLQCHKIADFTTDSALLACSANSDGTIIAGSENGRLHCFQLTGNK